MAQGRTTPIAGSGAADDSSNLSRLLLGSDRRDGGESKRVMAKAGRVVVVVVMVMGVMLLSLVSAVAADAKYMFNCKFSNEGCDSDNECCSSNCVQAHPGTNHRCTRSSLHRSCLYTYQCEERLTCGPANTCCSKYWGMCSRHEDCCYRDLQCLEAEGFYYKRCLMGRVDSSNSAAGLGFGVRLGGRLGSSPMGFLLVLVVMVVVVMVELLRH